MKKYVSYKDEKYYTYMLKLINSIGGRKLEYNWLITDIEAYPNSLKIKQTIDENEYLLLSNDELMDMLEEEDFQFIWGKFYAISNKYSKEEILKYKDNNCLEEVSEIIVRAEDSSLVSIETNDDNIIELFKKAYPKTKEVSKMKNKRKLDREVIATIIAVTIVSVISIISLTIGNIIINLGFIIVIIYLIIMVLYLISLIYLKQFRKFKLKKIPKDDLEIINDYYSIKKDWFKLLHFNLVTNFENIDYICDCFYKMKNKIPVIKGYDEFDLINHPNEEIRDYYKKAIKALDVIYKYYDKDGNRLI